MEARRLLEEIMNGSNQDDTPQETGGMPDMSQYPKRPLGEILDVLPEMAMDQLMAILNSGADDTTMTRELKVLLNRFEADLATVDTVPDYLAYMLVYYVLPQLRSQQQ